MSEAIGRAVATAERFTRAGTRFLLRTPLRSGALAVLRAAVRARPDLRLFSAPAFYASEVLAGSDARLVGRLKTGSRIHLLAADEVHRHIYFYGEYERPTTRFVRSIARPRWTFLDVGANAGYYSLLAADLGGPSSAIHAFEPNPILAELLTASASGVGGIHVARAACGDHDGHADLSLSPNPANSGLASLREDVLSPSTMAGCPNAVMVTVPLLTLDGYCAEWGLAPDVIKVDVEGYELEVLVGADRLLRDRVPGHVICEVVPERSPPDALLDLMAGHGYAVRSLEPDGSLRPYQEQAYQNVVFVRSIQP